MKLIISIVQDEDASRLVSALMNDGYRVTKLATTGGFLRAGNTTLLIGVEDAQVPGALSVIEKLCKSRRQMTATPPPVSDVTATYTPYPLEVTVGGATVFVLPVEQYLKY